jgi:predicted MFS family arabinose efflux permease
VRRMNDASAMATRSALRFVLLIGAASFFADFTYEGARSVLGPFLAQLGATATLIGFVTGLGELAGYGLRLASGRWVDATRRYWPIAILGYVVQMSAVPTLALAGSWPVAAALIVLERAGKAIRNPARDVMLSHAGKRLGGYGWAFGLHEGLDQLGALVGPLLVATVLARHGTYARAFAVLVVPGLVNLSLILVARSRYPRPQDLESRSTARPANRLPLVYWVYLAGAMLVAAGFADYPLIAYHLSRERILSGTSIAIFYAVAMAVSGCGSLVFGRLFDRYGIRVFIALTLVSTLAAPLVFLGGFGAALIGAALWGLGMGVHESVIPAAVSPMVVARRRGSAFGLFTAAYGLAWFVGSALIGLLYDHAVSAAVTFCVLTSLTALPLFAWASRLRATVPVDP